MTRLLFKTYSAICMLMFFLALASPSEAQKFRVIYTFDGSSSHPIAGLTIDGHGNLYGSSAWGGTNDNGTVYTLQRSQSGFVYSQLHSFDLLGGDGSFPWAGVTLGPDGSLYGTTYTGGTTENGIIYKITLAPGCHAGSCSGTESILYNFANGVGGRDPQAGLIFDHHGNFYGATVNGGSGNAGTVFEMKRSPAGWNYRVLYSFQNGPDGWNPASSLTFDSAGNLYGTTMSGGNPGCGGFGCGTVYQLTRSGGGWTKNTIYSFLNGTDGAEPTAGLLIGSSGNLFGATCCGGVGGGTVFELAPTGGAWTFNAFDLSGNGVGPDETLVMDSAGDLYGSSWGNGANGQGVVFKLTPTLGGWSYTALHDFTGGKDGAHAEGNLVIDKAGNLYGTTYDGGGSCGCGVVYEITPQ